MKCQQSLCAKQSTERQTSRPQPEGGKEISLSPLSSLPALETLPYLPVLTGSTVASGQDWPVVTSVSSGPWPSSPWLPPPRLRSHWELWPRECNGTDVVTPCQLASQPQERPLVPLHYLAEMGPCRTKTDITLSLSNWLNFGFITHIAFRFHHLITVNQRSTTSFICVILPSFQRQDLKLHGRNASCFKQSSGLALFSDLDPTRIALVHSPPTHEAGKGGIKWTWSGTLQKAALLLSK